MASSSKSAKQTMDMLRLTVSSTIDLLTQFESSLSTPVDTTISTSSTTPSSQTEIIDSPKLLQTSTTLIRAHTTKLSLLIITAPFTPTAIATVLRELSTGALPVLMSAVQSCSPDVWSKTFNGEVKRGTLRLLQELKSLLREIPLEAQTHHDEGISKTTTHNLTSTGVVWETCDALLRLEKQGIAGVVTGKAQEYQDLIEDAISELQDWMKEESEEDEGAEEDDILHESATATTVRDDDLEDLFQAEERFPKDDPELRTQLETAIKCLMRVKVLYKAIIKRRLRGFPPPPSQDGEDASERCSGSNIQRLDAVMRDLNGIQEETDGLAGAFYRLDGKQAARHLAQCLGMAKHAALALKSDWNGSEEDEFSSWLEKWIDMIDR